MKEITRSDTYGMAAAMRARIAELEEALQMAVNYRFLDDDLFVCTGCWSKAYVVEGIQHAPGCWMTGKVVDSKTGRKSIRPTQSGEGG